MCPAQALRRRDHEGVGVELVDAISYPVFELICSVRAPHASLHAHANLPTGRGHAKVPALPLGCIHEPGGCRKRRLSNVGARTG